MDVGDAIIRRNEIWVLVLDIAVVVLRGGDGGDSGRLDCTSVACAQVVFVSNLGWTYQSHLRMQGGGGWYAVCNATGFISQGEDVDTPEKPNMVGDTLVNGLPKCLVLLWT